MTRQSNGCEEGGANVINDRVVDSKQPGSNYAAPAQIGEEITDVEKIPDPYNPSEIGQSNLTRAQLPSNEKEKIVEKEFGARQIKKREFKPHSNLDSKPARMDKLDNTRHERRQTNIVGNRKRDT